MQIIAHTLLSTPTTPQQAHLLMFLSSPPSRLARRAKTGCQLSPMLLLFLFVDAVVVVVVGAPVVRDQGQEHDDG